MSDNAGPGNGTFVWYDLKTRELDTSWRFYSGLLGWRRILTDRPAGPYSMIRHEGRILGGMVPMAHEESLPSHWIGYVAVPDIAACVSAAVAEGGSAPLPPTEIPGIGLFAIICDPNGATVSPFQWTGQPDSPLPTGTGSFCWSELLTPDPLGAEPFYRRAFGWTVEKGRPGAYGAYWLVQSNERVVAGMVERPLGAGYPPHWLHYVRVERLESFLKEAETAGGGVLLPPTEIPDEGRFAILRDPGNALLGLFEGNGRR